MLDPGEPFFLGGGHQPAIMEEGGRGIMVETGNAQDDHQNSSVRCRGAFTRTSLGDQFDARGDRRRSQSAPRTRAARPAGTHTTR